MAGITPFGGGFPPMNNPGQQSAWHGNAPQGFGYGGYMQHPGMGNFTNWKPPVDQPQTGGPLPPYGGGNDGTYSPPPQTGGPLPPYGGNPGMGGVTNWKPPMGQPQTGGPLPPYQPNQQGGGSSMSFGGGRRPNGFLGNPQPMPRGGFRGY